MKNFIATAIVFAITSTSSVTASSSTKEPVARKVDANNVHTSSNSFGVGMYQIKGTESVKLMVETKQKLTVKITDSKGAILNREAINTSSAMNINLSDAPVGEYFVEISNGKETIIRQITKSASIITAE